MLGIPSFLALDCYRNPDKAFEQIGRTDLRLERNDLRKLAMGKLNRDQLEHLLLELLYQLDKELVVCQYCRGSGKDHRFDKNNVIQIVVCPRCKGNCYSILDKGGFWG